MKQKKLSIPFNFGIALTSFVMLVAVHAQAAKKMEAAPTAAGVETFEVSNVDCKQCVKNIKQTLCGSGNRTVCTVSLENAKLKLGKLTISPKEGETKVNKEELQAQLKALGADYELK